MVEGDAVVTASEEMVEGEAAVDGSDDGSDEESLHAWVSDLHATSPPTTTANHYGITGLSLRDAAVVAKASHDLLYAGDGMPDFWPALIEYVQKLQPPKRSGFLPTLD
jgi:hypothetical protein